MQREIVKPVAETVRVAVDGDEQELGDGFLARCRDGGRDVPGRAHPGEGAEVTAGFEFDVPVRFDTDRLDINLACVRGGRCAGRADGGDQGLSGSIGSRQCAQSGSSAVGQ